MNRGEGGALSLSCTGSEEGFFFVTCSWWSEEGGGGGSCVIPPFFPLPGLGPECLFFFPSSLFGEFFLGNGRACLLVEITLIMERAGGRKRLNTRKNTRLFL